MTKEEAQRILEQPFGSRDLNGGLEFYEAMLFSWGYCDDEAREREVERVRGLMTSTD